jgi:acylphosphatase
LRDGYVIKQVEHIKLPYFEPSSTVRERIIFSGKVQKVGFRLEIYELAKRLNLTGWVKNRSDKNVEAEIQGENEKIIFLIKFMRALKRASVHDVVINEIQIEEDETDFVLIKE